MQIEAPLPQEFLFFASLGSSGFPELLVRMFSPLQPQISHPVLASLKVQNIIGKVWKKRTWFWIKVKWLKFKVINEDSLANGADSKMDELCYIIIDSGNL